MGPQFSAEYWEDRYRVGGGASRHEPSPSLLAEAGDLPPGRALDAGCGHGADAVWLARRGWQVTAVDVSAAAVEQPPSVLWRRTPTPQRASTSGPRTWGGFTATRTLG